MEGGKQNGLVRIKTLHHSIVSQADLLGHGKSYESVVGSLDIESLGKLLLLGLQQGVSPRRRRKIKGDLDRCCTVLSESR